MRTEWASAYGDRCLDNFTYIRAQGLAHYSKHEATKYQTAATFPGCYYDGKLPEPRKRTGGTGTPAHEVQAVVPSFEYGLPTVWGGLDGDDPPIFESQAAYLKHHGLLLAGEERRADFEPVAV